jgi:hypothetical protein
VVGHDVAPAGSHVVQIGAARRDSVRSRGPLWLGRELREQDVKRGPVSATGPVFAIEIS